VRTAVFFVEPVQSLIHQFKYKHAFALAEPLADLMLRVPPRWRPPVDVIVPIPLHSRRRRQRGYNQAALLARHLSRRLHIRLNTSSLQRIHHTRSQVGLSQAARHANVADAFAVTDRQLQGEHVLLVDDVFTTGATLSAAAETLLAAGATAVSGYCLARARQN
jgi:ComF family protein